MKAILRVTYLLISMIWSMFLVVMAVITPVYFTPGWYIWSGIFMVLLVSTAIGTSKVLDIWEAQGEF